MIMSLNSVVNVELIFSNGENGGAPHWVEFEIIRNSFEPAFPGISIISSGNPIPLLRYMHQVLVIYCGTPNATAALL